MIAQTRLWKWQWVFVGGMAFAFVVLLISLFAWLFARISLAWLSQVTFVVLGLTWITSGFMIVTNWRGGLDSTIQLEQDIQRRRGKDRDAGYWERRRKVLGAVGYAIIVFGLIMVAFGVWTLTLPA